VEIVTISDAAVRAGFDALPGQAAVLDRSGRILVTNRAWREFGAANGGDRDHVGENYLNVCDATDDGKASQTAAAIRALADDERETVSIEYPCHGPERKRWFTMRGIRFEHGDDEYLLIIHVEITERKQTELELREQNERLETVANVLSHDLRNPLNVAIGRAELLESEHADALVRSLERMESIVSDALLLATHEEIEDTRPVELGACAERAWRQVETGDADLALAESATFRADPDLLGHIFENLFRNAVEHGCRTVEVGALDSGFYVSDDGPGIAPENRETVFDASYSTHEAGTGLGLAIVEQVVDAHGWSVSVTESAPDGAVGDARPIESDGGPETESANRGARFEITF
jgi:signal transduction histidine kinase